MERLRYAVLPSASSAGWIGGRQPGARTLLRWGSYQPPIRSLLARRRLLAVVADLKATDRNKGTKPVFKRVNPVAATTAGIFAVFRPVGALAAATKRRASSVCSCKSPRKFGWGQPFQPMEMIQK